MGVILLHDQNKESVVVNFKTSFLVVCIIEFGLKHHPLFVFLYKILIITPVQYNISVFMRFYKDSMQKRTKNDSYANCFALLVYCGTHLKVSFLFHLYKVHA